MIFLRVQVYTNTLVLDYLSWLHRDPYSNLGVVAEAFFFFFFRPLFRNELLTPPPPMTLWDRGFAQLHVGAVESIPPTQELAAKSVRVCL